MDANDEDDEDDYEFWYEERLKMIPNDENSLL